MTDQPLSQRLLNADLRFITREAREALAAEAGALEAEVWRWKTEADFLGRLHLNTTAELQQALAENVARAEAAEAQRDALAAALRWATSDEYVDALSAHLCRHGNEDRIRFIDCDCPNPARQALAALGGAPK